jgi:cell division inhibitor SepF
MELFKKIGTWFTDSENDEYEYETEEVEAKETVSEPEETPARPAPAYSSSRTRFSASVPESPANSSNASLANNVVNLPSPIGISQIYMMDPKHFDEMSDAVKALHEQKTVLLNLSMMEPDQAQRAVDFLSGATHALRGDLERVGDSIFIFAPSSVQLTTPATQADKNQAIPKPLSLIHI